MNKVCLHRIGEILYSLARQSPNPHPPPSPPHRHTSSGKRWGGWADLPVQCTVYSTIRDGISLVVWFVFYPFSPSLSTLYSPVWLVPVHPVRDGYPHTAYCGLFAGHQTSLSPLRSSRRGPTICCCARTKQEMLDAVEYIQHVLG